jgi:hypothetical protein
LRITGLGPQFDVLLPVHAATTGVAAQEVTLVARGQDGHGPCGWGERAAQVQAGQALLHDDEHDGLDG